jgi:serine O-acetyltransferase
MKTVAAETTIEQLVDGMIKSYRSDPRGQHINRRFLPSRDEILETVQLLLQLFYPGYVGRQDLTDENLALHVGTLLSTLREKVQHEIETCLAYAAETEKRATGGCTDEANALTAAFLERLPAIRDALIVDVQAAYDGDPAATSLDEVILAYPGFLAITVYRVAHELHVMGVPLMPRIMTEWAHSLSGADIHPGAAIGKSFFIDHSTGVVVGETTTIGANVKLYQGVTLGALSIPRDERGRAIRGRKRHPTVEDNVTVYANATVLGGETVLGADSVVGGSVFVTQSVPPASRVALRPPELTVRSKAEAGDWVI